MNAKSSMFALDDPADTDLLEDCRNSHRVAVLTGAGISAESGLATFRGDQGIWAKFKPEELASMDAFLRNPERVWEWYQYRRDVLSSAKPNPAHNALADWETFAEDFILITQNVDGLHQAAGSGNVIELHGNIRTNRCMECGSESSFEEITFEGRIPLCQCGGMLRPGVVWFGELLPEEEITRAFEAAGSCDLFLVVGTSAVVYPAASLPEIARDGGAKVIEINPESTSISPWATHSVRSNAGEALPKIIAALRNAAPRNHSPV